MLSKIENDGMIYSIIMPFDPLKYHAFENMMESKAFVPKEHMLHFPLNLQKYSKLKN